jgi:hypothetical protein
MENHPIAPSDRMVGFGEMKQELQTTPLLFVNLCLIYLHKCVHSHYNKKNKY